MEERKDENYLPNEDGNPRLNCCIFPVILVQIHNTLTRVCVTHFSRNVKQILEAISVEVRKLITRDINGGNGRVGAEDSSLKIKLGNQIEEREGKE